MFRPALRTVSSSFARSVPKHRAIRRVLSTAPFNEKSRSWKSSVARWGLAGALVYYYNTSNVFADEPAYVVHAPPEIHRETAPYPTIDTVAEKRPAQATQLTQTTPSLANTSTTPIPDDASTATGTPDELEEEASQQGAFNEETGEINWDCPCLGGMAHGPCGEQFRAAFSCFVFSKEEPKGVDCIEHFKTMQNCFREHPDVYGAELEDDEERGEAVEGQQSPVSDSVAAASETTSRTTPANAEPSRLSENVSHSIQGSDRESSRTENPERAQALKGSAKQQHAVGHETEEAVPKAWHDSR